MSFVDPMKRVPVFYFEEQEHGEDAVKSKELGYPVPKMVTVIRIIPHGHKGEPTEWFAEEYLARKGDEVRAGRFDGAWLDEYKRGFALYREGKAIPRSGTPLIQWERVLKKRREILAEKYVTVEDLAAVPDSSLGDIGMDGRVLRDLARGDIQAKKDLSPVVKELADANETIRRQQEQLDKLTARLDSLEEDKSRKKAA